MELATQAPMRAPPFSATPINPRWLYSAKKSTHKKAKMAGRLRLRSSLRPWLWRKRSRPVAVSSGVGAGVRGC